MARVVVVVLASAVLGCNGSGAEDVENPDTDSPTSPEPTNTLGPVGDGPVTAFMGTSERIGRKRDGLDVPQDLAFDPEDPTTLWVVSRKDDSVTRYANAGEPDQEATHIVDPFALHFMEQVSSIAFGAPGTFGTCQDSRNTYNGTNEANDFMGPTLWSSDHEVFGVTNPEAVEFLTDLFGFRVDLGSHLDMLHETPNCMGMAWEQANIYWIFDGFNGAIVRSDFRKDHGPGFDDHSDGIIERWVEGEVKREAGVVSHLIYDHDTALLYISDTGNNRIAVLDTTTGTRGDTLPVKEFGTQNFRWDNAEIRTLVDGNEAGLELPAGIELVEGLLLVTDAGTGDIVAFDLEGNEVHRYRTGTPGLAGIIARDLSDVWYVNRDDNEVHRLYAE